LSLLPGEERLFAAFPDAILPYTAIRQPRQGKSRIKIVCYQMVQEPCLLYDPDTKTCTQYEKRPMVCREYPFSSGGSSIEATCGWRKAQTIKYGETVIIRGEEQMKGESETVSFFMSLNQRMRRTGYTQLLMFDIKLREWVQLEPDMRTAAGFHYY
jgi:Fe-S-cluster containining protein